MIQNPPTESQSYHFGVSEAPGGLLYGGGVETVGHHGFREGVQEEQQHFCHAVDAAGQVSVGNASVQGVDDSQHLLLGAWPAKPKGSLILILSLLWTKYFIWFELASPCIWNRG